MSNNRVFIIGGGASGIVMAAQLVEALIVNKIKVEVLLFEKSKTIGSGLAYGKTSHLNLLNTPARTMGIYKFDSDHFVKWLQQHPTRWKSQFPGLGISSNSTPPRRLYGIYLENMAKFIAKRAGKNGIELNYVQEEVIDIDVNTMTLYLNNNQIIQGSIAILALGAFLSNPFPHLKKIEGYFHSPFVEESVLREISSTSDCIVVGSRLSGIDAILTVKDLGHRGKVFCISKSGRFPNVQGHWANYSQKFLTYEKLNRLTGDRTKFLSVNKLFYLIRREIEEAEGMTFRWKNFDLKNQSAEDFLLQEIAASTKVRKWQAALYNTNHLLTPLWQMFSQSDKKLILNKYLGAFLALRAAFPIQNAKKLYKLIKKNELEVLGDVKSVKYDSKKKVFLANFDDKIIQAPYLVNATGVSTQIEISDSILLHNLLKKKVIKAPPLGGIKVDADTLTVVDEWDRQHSNFFVIGGLLRGTHLITNLLEYIVDTAVKITKKIIKSIK